MCYIIYSRVFSLIYPTCNARAPYCHLWPVWLYHIIPHYLTNGKIFEKKKLLNMKCMFRFPLQFYLKHSSFYEESSVTWSKLYIGLHVNYPFFLSDFTETWFSRHIFEKYSNIKFHGNRFNGSRVVPCRQTDSHDEANNSYRNFVNAPTNSEFSELNLAIYTQTTQL
jgi:hypothetical protein